MANGSNASTGHLIRPLGAPQDEVREIAETEAVQIRPFRLDAYGEVAIAAYQPKTADEADKLQRTGGEVRNRRVATIAGLTVVILIVLAAVATFLGATFSTAPTAHEDAVRLLILVIGAVLGAVFNAEISKDRG